MAQREHLELDQGADAAVELELFEKSGSKKDLTGILARGGIKSSYDEPDSDLISFTTIIASPATDGIITMTLTNEQTAQLNPRLDYVYEVEIYYTDSGGETIRERVLEGELSVRPSIF